MIETCFTFISASINASVAWAERIYSTFGISLALLVFVSFCLIGVRRFFLSQML